MKRENVQEAQDVLMEIEHYEDALAYMSKGEVDTVQLYMGQSAHKLVLPKGKPRELAMGALKTEISEELDRLNRKLETL
jgi:hypothetical protein